MQRPIAPKGDVCPFHRKDVSRVCHKCPLYVQLRGKDPQTGTDIDQWSCSFAFMPVLTIENSAMQRQTGAAVESLRNEVVKSRPLPPELLQRSPQRLIPQG